MSLKEKLRRIEEARAKAEAAKAAQPAKPIRLLKPEPEPKPDVPSSELTIKRQGKPIHKPTITDAFNAVDPERAAKEALASGSEPASGKTLRERLDDFDRRSSEFDKALSELYWRMFRGEPYVGADIRNLQARKADFVVSSGYPDLIKEGLLKAEGLERRELELRFKGLLLGSVRSHPAVAQAMNVAIQAQSNFAANIRGLVFTEVQVAEMLLGCEDPFMRKAAWESQKQAMSLAPTKMNLIRTLNHVSQAFHDRKSYAHVLLETQESSPERLRLFIESFEGWAGKVFEGLKERFCKEFGKAAIAPHDFAFYMSRWLSRAIPHLAKVDGRLAIPYFKKTLRMMGFSPEQGHLDPEGIDKPPFTYDIGGGLGYAAEECALRMAPGMKDFRVFINPELSPSGLDFTRTLFLESGRMVHFNALESLDTQQAFRWDNDCMRHAIAMLFDSITEDERWLRDVADLPAADAARLSRMLQLKKLMMVRRLSSHALFELKVYGGAEPRQTFAQIEERFWGDDDPEAGMRWAWHPHLALNPGGQMSYLLGYMISNVISNDLRSRFGSLLHEGVAPHLSEHYLTGFEQPWSERLKAAVKAGK